MNKKIITLLLSCSLIFISFSAIAQEATISKKELTNSLNEAERALSNTPDDPELLWKSAALNYQLGITSNDINYFKTSDKRFNRLHELVPNDLRILSLAYDTKSRLIVTGVAQDIDSLKTLFNKFDSESKATVTPPSMIHIWARSRFPSLYGDNGKSDKELEDIYISLAQQSIKEQANFIYSYQLLSGLYADRQQYLLAIAIAKQGAQKAPENAVILNEVGDLYMDKIWSDNCTYNNQGDLKKAEVYYLKAIKVSPKTGDYHANLSKVYQVTHKRGILAINSAKKAAELTPSKDSLTRLASFEASFGSKNKATDVLKQIAQSYGKKAAVYTRATIAAYRNNFSSAYKISKIDKESSFYDYINKGIYGDQANKKRGHLYYSKKALKNTAITGRERELARFMVGDISLVELSQSNKTSCDELEMTFYDAYKRMQAGETRGAIEQLEKTIAFDFEAFHEHQLAKVLLEQLNQK